MMVTIHGSWTVGERLDHIIATHGSIRRLREVASADPDDLQAAIDLHDLLEYQDEPRDQVIKASMTHILNDEDLDGLTVRRLQLLLDLERLGGRAPSLRALARAAGRDVKNVSEDVQALTEFGFLIVADAPRGKPREVALAGERITIELFDRPPHQDIDAKGQERTA